jgi:WD repeat-containing protein 68
VYLCWAVALTIDLSGIECRVVTRVVHTSVCPPPPAVAHKSKMSANDVFENRELFTYTAPFPIYALAWSSRPDKPFRLRCLCARAHRRSRAGLCRLAMGSFLENYTNRVELVQLSRTTGQFESRRGFDHPYPATKTLFVPDPGGAHSDLLGTSGDYLRIWEVTDDGVKLKLKLDNNKNSEFCAPLTSFDWNETSPALVGTSSIDTTCTIWDLHAQVAKTQLIAHDKEVYDIAFARGTDVFASVGADGSVRLFDLRSLEHSTILYECPDPLLRLAWNKQDPNYLTTFAADSNKCVVLDVRVPSLPAAELSTHAAPINAAAW